MNKKNYVVLNCPCLKNEYACIENSLVRKFCYECSDCLIKQLYEKMKDCSCKLIELLEIEEVNG